MKYIKKFNESFDSEKTFNVDDRFQGSDTTLSKSDIERSWDLSEEEFDSEKTLAEFLDTCEQGDSWESESKVLTCN